MVEDLFSEEFEGMRITRTRKLKRKTAYKCGECNRIPDPCKKLLICIFRAQVIQDFHPSGRTFTLEVRCLVAACKVGPNELEIASFFISFLISVFIA